MQHVIDRGPDQDPHLLLPTFRDRLVRCVAAQEREARACEVARDIHRPGRRAPCGAVGEQGHEHRHGVQQNEQEPEDRRCAKELMGRVVSCGAWNRVTRCHPGASKQDAIGAQRG